MLTAPDSHRMLGLMVQSAGSVVFPRRHDAGLQGLLGVDDHKNLA